MFKSGSRYQNMEMNDSKIFDKLRIPLILFNDEYNKCIQNIDNLFVSIYFLSSAPQDIWI